jgi:uncharacterized membrane protein (GlpM family)
VRGNTVQILIKAALSLIIIFSATGIAKRFPSVAGLISVMPLTSVLVLIWVYVENNGDSTTMQLFAKGALWGIFPSILFFLVAFLCFKLQLSLPITLFSAFLVWTVAALIHYMILK